MAVFPFAWYKYCNMIFKILHVSYTCQLFLMPLGVQDKNCTIPFGHFSLAVKWIIIKVEWLLVLSASLVSELP